MTNILAPLESWVGCDGICVKVANKGRFLHLLRIDKSQGAYDISYDAWNYLVFGTSAVEDPHLGGRIQMSYEIVDTSKCQHLLKDGKLPLSAANSMNYVSSCISQPTSWVAQNYELYNIYDLVCKYGIDEKCDLDLTISNQPHCPGGLGSMLQLNSTAKNVMYANGELIPA
ncbi:FAD-linked oxidoreductase aurO [Fusarium oxysporum f. sp. albedinis]|nr:FAD-linked oxidoreductase aurO [Fusarium oxysporum f. sp. albedinis]